jgi:acetolactate synthase-1/2/3 large subunit
MKLSGGDMLAKFLADEGVDVVFGYPGGAVLHIYDALFKQSAVQHILVRHEQAATHAADGYARSTGKPGVVIVTSGPGATNAITGIATAYMDSIPMVVISGQVMSHLIGEDAFQETDMVGISRPIVKHSFLVKDPADIPLILKKAFYVATTGRPGPVVVDIPKDMTAPGELYDYVYPDSVSIRSYQPTVKGHKKQIKKALEMLLQAEKPVIYSGGGVVQGEASGLLTEIAQRLNIPVTNTLMGLGAYPGDDRQFLGMLGMHGTYEANMAMHESDFILAVGARFDDRVTNNTKKFCPHAKIAHIDVDPASIAKTVRVDVPIVGECASVLHDMLEMLKASNEKPREDDIANWWQKIDKWRQVHGLRYRTDDSDMLKPQTVIKTLYDVTKGDAYVTTDVGQHQMFTAQYYKFKRPRQWVNSGGLGTMGFGLPAAMGVQLAHPDALVCCVTGEGSIQMNIQELSTCTQYGIPVKIINVNNQALGMVRQWQDMQYQGRYSSSTYEDSLPDFVKLVESYGHVGMKVTDPKDLKAAMEEAMSLKDRLVFMDIYVDPSEHVYPMLIANQSLKDMWLNKTEKT